MSFYVRKSIKAGPFRFNLSQSGVGVSAGVPGFRVGTGPRGNYVRVGAGGVFYRSTQPTTVPPDTGWRPPPPAPVSDVLLEDVTGASATDLVPSGSDGLVEQLNQAASRWRLSPWLLVVLLVALIANPIVGAILLVPGLPGLIWLWYYDRGRRTVVAFYDVNDDAARWFEQLVGITERLSRCTGAWRIDAAGDIQTTYQYKVNAGATTIVSRSALKTSLDPPGTLATNIAVPSIEAGKATLVFLPDRLLVRFGRKFSDVAYSELGVEAHQTRFTESGRVPRDAEQVDTTWQYVNVRGGPDRRFKNNRRYPVLLYGELDLGSRTGLSWHLQFSQPSIVTELATALRSTPALAPERAST